MGLKAGKRRHRFRKAAFAICFLIVLCGMVFPWIIRRISKGTSAQETFTPLYGLSSADEWKDSLKDTPSDISGWTQYDKYAAGLGIADGSDTDGDGLTDKEEIETYGSNPLLWSTSLDTYSDGYKVSHGMDLSQKYEPDNIPENGEIDTRAILDTDTNTINYYAVVREWTSLDYTGITGTERNILSRLDIKWIYEAYSYAADWISFDVSAIGDADYIVYVMDMEASREGFLDVESEVKDGTLTIYCPFVWTDTYEIIITKKQDVAGRIASAFTNGVSSGKTDKVIIVSSPFLTRKFGLPFLVYYASYGEASDSLMKNTITKDIQTKIPGSNVSFKKMDPSMLSRTISLLSMDPLAVKVSSITDAYKNASAVSFARYEIRQVKYTSGNTDAFDKFVDELPFPNFGTSGSPGGSCLGLSYYTMKLFNAGVFPAEFVTDGYAWNLNVDEDNQTLMDRGLSDYKTGTFTSDKTDENGIIKLNRLTSGEKNFVNMIEYYQVTGNKMVDASDARIESAQGHQFSLIKRIMGIIDDGKCATLALDMKEGGHAFVAYDYKKGTDSGSIIWLYVYDCNFPMDETSAGEISGDGFCRIMITRKGSPLTGNATFVFSYEPLSSYPSYGSDSRNENCVLFAMMDDDMNLYTN
jgi:hypothetical protein